MGVPDYVPAEIVEGGVTVMPNAFGSFWRGAVERVEAQDRQGDAGAPRPHNGRYVMHLMTATARTPQKWEEAGWAPPAPQLPSLEFAFDGDPGAFAQKVMSQHYIIAYGDQRAVLEEFCASRD